MIKVDTIFEENNKAVSWNEEKKCLIVPVSLTEKGFDLIDKERKKIKIQE